MINRLSTLLLFCWYGILSASAQNTSLTARVVDAENNEALVKATTQLYRINSRQGGRRDTTFVAGKFSDASGHIAFNNLAAGSYLLRLTFLGYKAVDKSFRANGSDQVALGRIRMEADAQQLKETVITANLPKMLVKDDTVVYNADAFRVPEGSVIVRRLTTTARSASTARA